MWPVFSKAQVIVWGKPLPTQKERDLLRKIDWFVLSFVCLNYWINYLDRSNVANAYVSGMQEDLHMVGNQYNIVNTCFTVGYVVGMIPNNLILLRVSPRYWLSICSMSWGLLTLGMYKVHSYQQICVIRFFQGLFEASTFVGTHLILGSWYTADELAKRTAIFTSSGLMGSLFSSFMQSAIHSTMDGRHGLAGWRWLFIIDFVITVPVCVYGFIFFPGVPERCTAFYFSEEERHMAAVRVPAPKRTQLDWTVVRRVFGRWHWWFFSLLWVFGGENVSYASNSLFALWLKYFNYTIAQRNHYPMGVYGVGIVATFGSALYIDSSGAKNHWRVGVFISSATIVATILLLVHPFSPTYVFAAHYISGVAYAGQTAFFAWANQVCHDDLEERAVVLASMNMFSGAVNAWWSILFYGADTVPRFRKGCYAMLATTTCCALFCIAIRVLQLREESQKEIFNAEKLRYDELEGASHE
ncbi:hypothetical protein BABINDRAFT_6413 [Babjeviella inositovora NRRL Y-12698]|uniref:Major facilitator superfamily (MFS) profile domain-containing protein n=1 Tax=Babjeviella inositovora NRRL Y-12698 TaxID=984486 RepID=A0A1E3QVS3_9ASCO|nr:uncharacterized protein BABINDRAFT_6413 [Babjeviella inositovora NRRL Y-12698]ODQ81760.1 hypothetical protein BABINDRAFT_6413 [Babjeviella inositovora NRRL Y-12698]